MKKEVTTKRFVLNDKGVGMSIEDIPQTTPAKDLAIQLRHAVLDPLKYYNQSQAEGIIQSFLIVENNKLLDKIGAIFLYVDNQQEQMEAIRQLRMKP